MYSLLPKRGEPSFYGQTTHFIFFEAEILLFINSDKRNVSKRIKLAIQRYFYFYFIIIMKGEIRLYR